MPWECKSCGHAVPLDTDSTCPACGVGRSTWTVVGGMTRTMTVPRAKGLKALRGTLAEPVAADHPLWITRELAETTTAPTVTKAHARALVARGLLPASSALLFVRVTAGGEASDVTVGVDYAQQERAERPLSRDLVAGGMYDVVVLLVHGAGGVDGIAFPGIDVVDITEGDGYAPELEVSGPSKKPIELLIELVGEPEPAPEPDDLVLRVEPALRFANDSPLPMPLEGSAHHPLQALVAAAGFLADHPEHVLVLAGHASAPGSGKHNAALGRARADGVLHLLRGDQSAWVALATEHGSLQDVKAYLSYLTRERGWSCDPGPVTPKNDGAAQAGLEPFQREYNQRFGAALDVDGVCGKQTLSAVFDLLSLELDRWLEKHGLARVDLRLHPDVPVLSCGETLAENPKLPQPASEESRRFVDLLLLSGPVQQRLGAPDAATLYAEPLRFEELPLPDEPGAWEFGSLLVVTDLTLTDLMHGKDVRYVLRSEQGDYERELSAQEDAIDVDGAVDLRFEQVPTAGTYTLVAHVDERESVVFEGATYAELCRPVQLTRE